MVNIHNDSHVHVTNFDKYYMEVPSLILNKSQVISSTLPIIFTFTFYFIMFFLYVDNRCVAIFDSIDINWDYFNHIIIHLLTKQLHILFSIVIYQVPQTWAI